MMDGAGGTGGGGGFGSLLGAGTDDFSGRRGRWRKRFRRALPAIVCVVGVVVLLVSTVGDDVDQGNLKGIPALALLWTAATYFLWRRADGEGFAALLLRRRFRRAVYRCALVLIYLGFVAFWLASYAHFEATDEFATTNLATDTSHFQTYGDLRTWLMLAGVALALVEEPLLWRAWPRSAHAALHSALVQKAYAEAKPEWIARKYGFDPGVGAVGRPNAVVSKPAKEPGSAPLQMRPTRTDARHGQRLRAEDKRWAENWWTNALLDWDGEKLTVTDAGGIRRDLPLQRADGDATHIAEIVWSGVRREGYETLDVTRSLEHDWIFFLDAAGRQYARMPGLGFTSERVVRIAQAAGLAYHRYDLGVGALRGTSLPFLLFPPRRETLILGIR